MSSTIRSHVCVKKCMKQHRHLFYQNANSIKRTILNLPPHELNHRKVHLFRGCISRHNLSSNTRQMQSQGGCHSYHHYNIRGCMCSTGPFQYRWLKGYIYSSCYHHHQIGSIHFSHCYHIFPWLCAWDVCCITFCHLLHIHSGKTGNLFSLLVCSLWWVQIVGFVLACRSCSFVCTLHHLIFIIVQTYLKTLPVRYILSSVWVRLSIFFQLSIIQYVRLCVFSLPISVGMIERIYIRCLIIIMKSEVWTITHCYRVRSRNNGMRCMSFYILITWTQSQGGSFLRKSYQSTWFSPTTTQPQSRETPNTPPHDLNHWMVHLS